MACESSSTRPAFLLLLCFLHGSASAQLSSTFYSTSCPSALSTIKSSVSSAVKNEARMGASLLRLHFHDCFVNESVLYANYAVDQINGYINNIGAGKKREMAIAFYIGV